jgi:hypothetical protein
MRLALIVGTAFGIAVLLSAASAQDVMNPFFPSPFFFGGNPQQPPSARPVIHRHFPVIRRRHSEHHHQHFAESEREPEHKAHRHKTHSARASYDDAPSVAYCVRLCDGRYFRLAKSASDEAGDLCKSSCPDAPTELFFGDDDVNKAESEDGVRYDALPNAFVYRNRVIPDCSCIKGRLGTAAIDVEKDPTLERGDVVITHQGPAVVKDGEGKKSQPTLVPVKNYSKISSDIRRFLKASDIAVDTPPADADQN